MDPQENQSQEGDIVPHENQSQEGDMDPEENRKGQNTRGPTRMSKIARKASNGELSEIEIDRLCVYHGPNRPAFASYLGYLVRKYMPIGYNNWKLVPKADKDQLYDRIKVNSITCFTYLFIVH